MIRPVKKLGLCYFRQAEDFALYFGFQISDFGFYYPRPQQRQSAIRNPQSAIKPLHEAQGHWMSGNDNHVPAFAPRSDFPCHSVVSF